LIKSGIKNIQLFELGVAGDRRGRGMTATGMIVINPPWQLLEKMTLLLPRLVDLLSEDNSARFRAEVLAGE
jgi:23S rRNA (adenine2030-N6)-methyltransferase